ncbi:MAG: ribosome biogenesis GTPase Der [Verrucomicrobia bacterium]|nr:ribosome biogenesis GTPase Der [Verrucomicrobiota bacterium]
MSDLIAIVGRPNVGKSALFNRLVGRRIAIVHDEPGVTRDRISAEAEWRGRPFTLVDTGGIGLLRGEKTGDPIVQAAFKQVQIAIESANVILLVVNAQEGLVPLDREVATQLRRSGKPVVVAVNKADNPKVALAASEFAELGFTNIAPVSAIHGHGIDAVLKTAVDLLPAARPEPADRAPEPASPVPDPSPPLKLAIVGRPNVGKSSILNALTQSERVIVSPIPGTTRDAVDVPFEITTDGVVQRYVLIDTAGVRKRRSVADSIEFFSVQRAERSIARCDIVVFVLDAASGILEQDKKVADLIVENHKACILVVNKWDLFEAAIAQARRKQARGAKARTGHGPRDAEPQTLAEFGRWVQERLFFLDYAPVIFASAQTGFHLERLLEAVRYVAAQLQQRIPTALLNRTLHEAVERRQPVSAAGHRLKFFYATQVQSAPPTFLLFVNRADLFSEPYRKYLAGELRRAFGYEGCPIVLVAKPRPQTIEPVRKKRRRTANDKPAVRK